MTFREAYFYPTKFPSFESSIRICIYETPFLSHNLTSRYVKLFNSSKDISGKFSFNLDTFDYKKGTTEEFAFSTLTDSFKAHTNMHYGKFRN